MLMTFGLAFRSFAILSLILQSAQAANDWKVPCFNGVCEYDLSGNDAQSGTLKIWGSADAITDITGAADWEILNCSSEKLEQDVRLVCKDDEDKSGCAHLYQNVGAVGKIVRLPETCGKSAFARVSRAWVHEDQSIPSPVAKRLFRRDGAPPLVKGLALDTNFGAVDWKKTGPVNLAVTGANFKSGVDVQAASPAISSRRRRDRLPPRGFISGAIDGIKDAANKAKTAVGGAVDTVEDKAKQAADAAREKAAEAAAQAKAAALKAKQIAEEKAKQAAAAAKQKAAEIKAKAQAAANKAKEEAEAKAKEVAAKAKQAKEKAQDAAEKAKEKVEEKAKEAADKAKEKAKQLADKAKEEAKQVADKAKETAGKVKDKVEDVKDKVEEKTEKAVDKVKDKAGEVKDKVEEKTKEAVGAVKDKAGEVKDKVKEVAGAAKDKVEGAVDKAKETVGDVVDKAKDGAGKVIDKVGDGTKEVLDDAGEVIDKTKEAIKDGVKVDKTIELPPLNLNKNFNLLDRKVSCPPLEAGISIDINSAGTARVSVGVAATGTLVPPRFDDFQLTAGLDADLDGKIVMSGDISGVLDSGRREILELAIPGLSIPGVLAVGPTLSINVQAKASMNVNFEMDVGFNYKIEDAQLFFPPKDQKSGGSFKIKDTPLTLSSGASAEGTGTVEAHLIPGINFGITALNDIATAQVFLDLDAKAALSLDFNAGVRKTSRVNKRAEEAIEDDIDSATEDDDPHFDTTDLDTYSSLNRRQTEKTAGGCARVNAGLAVNAGARGTFFNIFDETAQVTLFERDLELFKKCFGNQAARRDLRLLGRQASAAGSEKKGTLQCLKGLVKPTKLNDGTVSAGSIGQ